MDFQIHFTLSSDRGPTGGYRRVKSGNTHDGTPYQTLLGVTGSGKTFTMANVIERVQEADSHFKPQQNSGRTII